jgi:D-glycero-D-manno-heptose 1,7-bisphosphate phosphatase
MHIMKICILDRDGTINADRDDFVKSVNEWQPLPGALEAIARINHAGWHVVVASNQSGLGRGLFDVAALNAIHAKMHSMLAAVGGRIDAVFYCPHAPEEACTCRKPAPGLFEQIAERYGVSLAGMPSVGDSARDLVAAVAVGCAPHVVLTGKAAGFTAQSLPTSYPVHTVVHADLAAFADYLVAQT